MIDKRLRLCNRLCQRASPHARSMSLPSQLTHKPVVFHHERPSIIQHLTTHHTGPQPSILSSSFPCPQANISLLASHRPPHPPFLHPIIHPIHHSQKVPASATTLPPATIPPSEKTCEIRQASAQQQQKKKKPPKNSTAAPLPLSPPGHPRRT